MPTTVPSKDKILNSESQNWWTYTKGAQAPHYMGDWSNQQIVSTYPLRMKNIGKKQSTYLLLHQIANANGWQNNYLTFIKMSSWDFFQKLKQTLAYPNFMINQLNLTQVEIIGCDLTTPVIKLFQFKMHVIPFYNKNKVELEIH